jgi:oligoendopeptidase F
VAELHTGLSSLFARVDPALGGYYDRMRAEGLLDLESRKNKAPGAYCEDLHAAGRAFILANVVGTHDDVRTMLHEAGHAFHAFERAQLPLFHQRTIGMEIAEVASMAMELLAAPYLPASAGGLYSQADAGRALVEHLETCILFWPFMAVVDGFQHWAYENSDKAGEPAACDEAWAALWRRFMRGVDWTGLDREMATGWHRKPHIHQDPFYYVEYGLAQLGAVQIWRNSLQDHAGAVAAYRRALALGGTAPLPALYEAAGVRFAFDAATLREAVALMETTISDLASPNP